MSFNLRQLLLAPFFVEQSTIYVGLPSYQVRRAIAAKLSSGEIVVGETDYWWSDSRRYTGNLDNHILHLKGPFGHKKWALETRVEIVDELGGTALLFTLQLSAVNLFFALTMLAVYVGVALFVLDFWPIWQFLAFQVLFLYGVILAIFKYEASLIKEMIRRWATES